MRRAASLSAEQYQARIKKGLDKAFRKAVKDKVELSKLKTVVFSDLHRGARDKADDFERCERAYSAALGWYLEQGYVLYLLGDVEELWENGIDEVIPSYLDQLALEQEFRDRTGLRRFYGNHDLDWKSSGNVAKHLHPHLPGVEVIEALRLTVLDEGKPHGLLFLAHGHQGTSASERWAWLSRRGLRWLWRPIQRASGLLSTTPAEDTDLRAKHDVAMYVWASDMLAKRPARERPVLIAGHTHHPVFPGKPPKRPDRSDEERLKRELENAPAHKRPAIRAELELVRAKLREKQYTPPHEVRAPCYFNTGCCCFPGRDVTCLEINGNEAGSTPTEAEDESGGLIRLVRWLDNQGRPRPQELAAMPLRELFRRIADG